MTGKEKRDKDKTGIHEQANGFVGRLPVFDSTRVGRPRVRIDVYCGENKPDAGKFSILRHCVAYDDLAVKLKEARGGMYFTGYGWLSKEQLRDEFGRLVFANEKPEFIEHLILHRAEIREHEKVAVEQLPLEKTMVGGHS